MRYWISLSVIGCVVAAICVLVLRGREGMRVEVVGARAFAPPDPIAQARRVETSHARAAELVAAPRLDLALGAAPTEDVKQLLSEALRQDEAVLSEAARSSLLDVLAGEALVRAKGDADAFVAWVKVHGGIPAKFDPETMTWKRIAERGRHLLGHPPDPSTPEATLRAMVAASMSGNKSRVSGVVRAPTGTLIFVSRVASPAEANDVPFAGQEEAARWIVFGASGAYSFRAPSDVLQRVIGRDGSALVCHSFLGLIMEDGGPMIWHSVWVFDTATSQWSCIRSGRRSPTIYDLYE